MLNGRRFIIGECIQGYLSTFQFYIFPSIFRIYFIDYQKFRRRKFRRQKFRRQKFRRRKFRRRKFRRRKFRRRKFRRRKFRRR